MSTSPEKNAVLAAWKKYTDLADRPEVDDAEVQSALDEYIDSVQALGAKCAEVAR